MYNFVTSAIANVASILKSLRLKQTLMVLMVGLLLLTGTACGRADATMTPRSNNNYNAPGTTKANERPSKASSPYAKGTGPEHELYKPIQEPRGGMNNYNDDLGYERGESVGKAKQLIDRAESRLEKRAENPQELIENARETNPFVEGSRDVSKRVNATLEAAKKNISEDMEKGPINIKDNLHKGAYEAPKVVDKAKENAYEATRGLREGASDVSKAAQRAVDRM